MRSIVFRLRRGLWLLALCLCLLPAAHAGPPVQLDDPRAIHDAWPAATVLFEDGTPLSLEQALASPFVRPSSPHANLGRQAHAAWLRVPVVAAADGRWVLQVDFAGLDRVEGWLLADGRVVAQGLTGDQVPLAQRAMYSLAPAWDLMLRAGVSYEVLLRVQSSTPLVVPMHFMTPATFERAQDDRLLLHGVLAGLGLALLVYAAIQWSATRDPMFAWYGLASLSGTLYFLAFTGVGARHLWGYGHWWTQHAVGLTALGGAVAAAMLADTLLDMPNFRPRVSRLLRASAVLAAVLALGLLAGLLPFALVQVTGPLLLLWPAVVSVVGAAQRWRGGDPAAPYLLVGWAALLVGMLPMVLLLRGWLDAGFWSQYAAPAGRVMGMLCWLRVLGVRMEQVRRRAERAEHEHRQLHVLAHADALTGLPNRRGLDQAIQSALQRAAPERRVAVFVGDLDGFKAVNDRLGHEAGDDLLVGAARRLRAKVRRGDVVARLGGDEFVVVAEGLVTEEDARHLGRLLVDAFAEPFALRGEQVNVGLTLGFALTPGDGHEAADLLRRADEAMYAGKRAGKARLVRCEPLPAR